MGLAFKIMFSSANPRLIVNIQKGINLLIICYTFYLDIGNGVFRGEYLGNVICVALYICNV